MLILIENPPHAQWAAALLSCLNPEPQQIYLYIQEAALVHPPTRAPPPAPALPDLARALLREHGDSADDSRNHATVMHI
jgi:hypothetical protein